MAADTLPSLEHILIAVGYKLGAGAEFDNRKLTEVMFAAADTNDDLKRLMALDRHYRTSEPVEAAFLNCRVGGIFEREPVTNDKVSVTPHTSGEMGKSVYESFGDEVRAFVDRIAEGIR